VSTTNIARHRSEGQAPFHLALVQRFSLRPPLCDWPECIRRARAFYVRLDGSAMALCSLHVDELVDAGMIDPGGLPVYADWPASLGPVSSKPPGVGKPKSKPRRGKDLPDQRQMQLF
jgi:hypothetical protein